jgi:hypothetical protein
MRTLPLLVCILSPVAFGQFASMKWQQDGDTMTVTLGQPLFQSRYAVVGAPYSGERVSERVQTLTDGTHISTITQNHQKTFRDSQGRIRREQSLVTSRLQAVEGGEFILVEIDDPVAGFTYVLDESNKAAHRYALKAAPQTVAPQPASTRVMKPRPQPSREQLGSRNIEGVIAEGTRVTSTTPIGEVGNDRPIVSIHEMWYCQELQLTVLEKSADPRYGEDTARVANISRAEPDPALFMPPAGYTIVDETDSFTMALKKQ